MTSISSNRFRWEAICRIRKNYFRR